MNSTENKISLNADFSKKQIEASSASVEFIEELAELCEELFKLLVRKNIDYNTSFIDRGEQEAAGPSPINDEQQAILNGLRIRTGDKQQRFEQLLFEGEAGMVPEKLPETTLDAAGYWILKTWVLENYE
jgi:hypothetical protein